MPPLWDRQGRSEAHQHYPGDSAADGSRAQSPLPGPAPLCLMVLVLSCLAPNFCILVWTLHYGNYIMLGSACWVVLLVLWYWGYFGWRVIILTNGLVILCIMIASIWTKIKRTNFILIVYHQNSYCNNFLMKLMFQLNYTHNLASLLISSVTYLYNGYINHAGSGHDCARYYC
jgi:hypothetical protein